MTQHVYCITCDNSLYMTIEKGPLLKQPCPHSASASHHCPQAIEYAEMQASVLKSGGKLRDKTGGQS